MARLFNRGLLPFSVWEQLLEAESMMDHEVHDVQAEAEKLQKGWGCAAPPACAAAAQPGARRSIPRRGAARCERG